jgi:hypothetical protein
LVWIALFLSLLACGLSCFFYWRFRRKQELSVEQFSNRVSGLLSEFNSVTSSKVDLLDDRTEELRRIVDLANLKIKKLEKLVEMAEETEKILEEEKEPVNLPDGDSEKTQQEKVIELAKDGKTPTEIAERTELTPGEISVILKVNRTELEETPS